MSNLIKWQIVSMVSRFLAMIIGIVQGIFIVRFLSTADYGLVGIVTAVGSVTGIILHLGLVSGATREIAASQDQKKAFKIFVSALYARLSLAFFLFFVLFFGSSFIARRIYQHPEISLALKIYALVLLVQASQGIFNAVLSGFKRFKSVFIFQVAIALVSLSLYVPLIYYLGFYGYFWAMLVLAVVHTATLFFLAWQCFGGVLVRPNLDELRSSLKAIFSVGLAIYLVKIIFTLWERLGPLVLGKSLAAAEVGIFTFALFYSTKLMTASDAITDVSLPVFTEKFSGGLDKFKADFLSNFKKIYAFITLAAAAAVFWSPELVRFIAAHKYDEALPLIPFLILAFWAYSFVNIIKSSIMVPAKLNREMIISYTFLLAGTTLGFFGLRSFGLLEAMVWAMALGGLMALFYQWLSVRNTLHLDILSKQLTILTTSLLPLFVIYILDFGFLIKIGIFLADLSIFLLITDKFGILNLARVSAMLRRRLRCDKFFVR